MRMLAVLLLGLSLFIFAAPGLLAEDEKPDSGGSAFDEPKVDEDKPPDEPKPATYAFKDYKLELNVEDGRFWKHDKNYSENDEKAAVVLKLRFKLPKSESPFDIIVSSQGWSHKSGFDFDGVKVGASNYKKLCDVFFGKDMESWKDVKNPEKPKASRVFKRIKAYRYALTGTPSGWSMPVKKEAYFFKFGSKTYLISVMLSTTAAKSERVTKELENLLKSLKERKTRRR